MMSEDPLWNACEWISVTLFLCYCFSFYFDWKGITLVLQFPSAF